MPGSGITMVTMQTKAQYGYTHGGGGRGDGGCLHTSEEHGGRGIMRNKGDRALGLHP